MECYSRSTSPLIQFNACVRLPPCSFLGFILLPPIITEWRHSHITPPQTKHVIRHSIAEDECPFDPLPICSFTEGVPLFVFVGLGHEHRTNRVREDTIDVVQRYQTLIQWNPLLGKYRWDTFGNLYVESCEWYGRIMVYQYAREHILQLIEDELQERWV